MTAEPEPIPRKNNTIISDIYSLHSTYVINNHCQRKFYIIVLIWKPIYAIPRKCSTLQWFLVFKKYSPVSERHKPLIVKLWSKINFPVLLIYCFNVLICFHFRRGWMDYFLMHFSVLYSVFTLLLSIASAEHGLSQLKFVKANLRTK
jgi:hypothetical protein